MKFTLSWLKTHLDTDAGLQTITDTLTAIGLELESVQDRGAALAPFRIARIAEAVQHPNADRLRVCQVETGDGTVSVVCGAPNARAGIRVIFAPPGSYIPGSNITIKTGEIRGVQSAGMLCSLRELGLGEESDGIAELPGDAPIGAGYAAWAGLDDPVIEIGVTPNRGDAFAVRGVARDLAAAGIGTLKPFTPAPVPGGFPSPITWQNDWPDACPWILGRLVRGVRNGPSPAWLRDRLTAIGLRPINALVDITNFFTVDLGRPLHVFDADRIAGGVLTLRRGQGESFHALNGRDITTVPEDLVIADEAGVQSLAGIVGGEATGSTEDTSNVFIECALFDPVAIARAGQRHAITTDARQRFERGIDPSLLPAALDAATRMVIELCGGEAGAVVQSGAEPRWQRQATLRFARLESLGGLAVPAEDAVSSLERLGFTVQARDADRVTVAVPPWRNDVAPPGGLDLAPALMPRAAALAESVRQIEPECDLIEEVLRLRGLDAVPAISLPRADAVPQAVLTPRQTRSALTRRVLAAQGLVECVTFSFMEGALAATFDPAHPAALALANPIAADLNYMRPSIVPNLAQAAARNAARGWPDAALFELGPIFAASGQQLAATGLRCGTTPRHPLSPARAADALDAKGDVWAVLAALGVPMEALSVTPDAPDFYHPGRSGTVRQGPKIVLAQFGELHPRIAAALDLPGPAMAFEIFLDAIPDPKRRRKAAPALPPLQPVRRDFAFLAPADVSAEAVIRAARGAERNLIAAVTLFDVFTGGTLPAGQKSIGIEVVFQPTERTLTEAELDAAGQKVAAAVAKATGATLRG